MKLGRLSDAVDDPAAAAAAEDHRVGALEHLDPVDIVEVAEILNVVAHAVDEEVGGAAELPRSTIWSRLPSPVP